MGLLLELLTRDALWPRKVLGRYNTSLQGAPHGDSPSEKEASPWGKQSRKGERDRFRAILCNRLDPAASRLLGYINSFSFLNGFEFSTLSVKRILANAGGGDSPRSHAICKLSISGTSLKLVSLQAALHLDPREKTETNFAW